MNLYVKRLKALSDETRLRIMRIILESEYELCVCEIVDALSLPFYTISKHLKELKNALLLDEIKNGKFVMYSFINSNDKFLVSLTELIKAVPEDFFEKDFAMLNRRLSIRENGKCVVGMSDKITEGN